MHDPHYSIFAGAGIIGALLGPVFGPLVMLLFAAVMGGLLAMGRTSTRTVAGTAVGCPEGTPFKPVWADYDFNTLVIGLGRNNLNISERPTVKRDVEACVFDGESSPGNRYLSIYVDKAQKLLTGASAWDGGFNVPAATPVLGFQTAFQPNYPSGVNLGRPSIWNMTGSTKPVSEILSADWDEAQGYLT